MADTEINMRSLRRADADVTKILASASQVAVYNFNATTNQWMKRDIEGSMFIVQRSSQPRYAFVVMNRLNTNNWMEYVTSDLELKLQAPYLLCKNSKLDIFCIWFYDLSDSENISSKLQQLVDRAAKKDGIQKKDSRSAWPAKSSSDAATNSITDKLAKIGLESTGEKSKVSDETHLIQSLLQKSSSNDNESSKDVVNGKKVTTTVLSSSVPTARSLNLQDLFNSSLTSSEATVLKKDAAISNSAQQEQSPTPMQTSLVPKLKGSPDDFVLTPALLKQGKLLMDEPIEGNGAVREQSPPTLSSQQPAQLFRPTPTHMVFGQFYKNLPQPDSLNPLSMEQLKQTLIYLLQNNADFLHSIHSAYMMNFYQN